MNKPPSASNRPRGAAAAPGSGGNLIAWLQRNPAWLCLPLSLLVFLVFFPAVHNEFVEFDDPVYVTFNPHVQNGLTASGIRWAFTSTELSGNWHPLTWLSHMLDCQMFGLNPRGHHLTSIIFHSLNAALLFLVLLRMTGAPWRSLFVAAVFGLHPLRVESVAWVAERKDVLSTFFLLLTLYFYARFVAAKSSANRKSGRFYGTAVICFALGLMSKPMLVTLPFVLLLLDYWPLERFKSDFMRLLREKIPFFVLAAASSAITFYAQQHAGAMRAGVQAPFPSSLENVPVSYCRYLEKTFLPVKLAYFYPHPRFWPRKLVAGSTLLFTSLTLLALALRRKRPYWFTGWFWFIGTLVPVIGLVQVGSQSIADRYMYVPSIGLFVLLTWAVCDLTRRWHDRAMILSGAAIGVIFFCSALTVRQIGYWQNDELLFRHATEVTSNNFPASSNLAITLDKQGRLDEAVYYYQQALKASPGDVPTICDLAVTYGKLERFDDAADELQTAIKLDSTSARAHCDLGAILERQGRTDDAIHEFETAIKLKPDYTDAHLYLGLLLEKQGQYDDAIQHLSEGLKSKPGFPELRLLLGSLLIHKGNYADAIAPLRDALSLAPDNADGHNDLGVALKETGALDEAIGEFHDALRLKPDFSDAQSNLDATLELQRTAIK